MIHEQRSINYFIHYGNNVTEKTIKVEAFKSPIEVFQNTPVSDRTKINIKTNILYDFINDNKFLLLPAEKGVYTVTLWTKTGAKTIISNTLILTVE